MSEKMVKKRSKTEKTNKGSKVQRPEHQIIMDKNLIAALYEQGFNAMEMSKAPELSHITYRTIYRDLREIKLTWHRENISKIDRIKERQVLRHEAYIDDLQKDLELSREGLTEEAFILLLDLVDKKKLPKKDFDNLKKRLNKPGSPALYKELRENSQEISKIYDIYPAQKKDLTITPKESLEDLTEEELLEELDQLDQQDDNE